MGQLAHLRHYAEIEGCEVVALAEPRPETAALVARKFGIPHVYSDPEQMLAEQELNGVVASQPFQRHLELLPPLFKQVRHVMTEKPLANSTAAGEALVAAAREAGSVHMVGYMKRCDPAMVAAKATIARWQATGEMGALRYVRVIIGESDDWLLRSDTTHVEIGEPRPEAEFEPVPDFVPPALHERYFELVNGWVHNINFIRHLAGEPFSFLSVDKPGLLYVGQTDSGVSVVMEAGAKKTANEWEETILIAFERGWVSVAFPPPLSWEPGRVEVWQDGTLTVPTVEDVPAFRKQAEAFVAVCRGEQAPPVDSAEALLDMHTIDTAIEVAPR